MRATCYAAACIFAFLFFSRSTAAADQVADAKAALTAYIGPSAQVVQMFVSGPWALGAYQGLGSGESSYAEVLLFKPPGGNWSPFSPRTHKVMSAGGVFGSNTMVYTFDVTGLDALALAQQESEAKAVDANEGAFQWLDSTILRRYCDDGTHTFGSFIYYEFETNYDGQIVPRYHRERWTVTRQSSKICNPLRR